MTKVACFCLVLSVVRTFIINKITDFTYSEGSFNCQCDRKQRLEQEKPVSLFIWEHMNYFKADLLNSEPSFNLLNIVIVLGVFTGQNYPRKNVDEAVSKPSKLLIAYLKISESLVG